MTTSADKGEWIDYDYAVVRVVPRVHRGSFIDIGVVVFARQADYLASRFIDDLDRIPRLGIDPVVLKRFIDAYDRVCTGGVEAGPIGLLPRSERFHWLTAPRSAVLQTSPVHPGRSRDLACTLQQLFDDHCR